MATTAVLLGRAIAAAPRTCSSQLPLPPVPSAEPALHYLLCNDLFLRALSTAIFAAPVFSVSAACREAPNDNNNNNNNNSSNTNENDDDLSSRKRRLARMRRRLSAGKNGLPNISDSTRDKLNRAKWINVTGNNSESKSSDEQLKSDSEGEKMQITWASNPSGTVPKNLLKQIPRSPAVAVVTTRIIRNPRKRR